MKVPCCLVLIGLWLIDGGLALAKTEVHELKEVATQIRQVRQKIVQQQQRRDSVNQELRQLKQRLSAVQQKLGSTNQQLARQQGVVTELTKRQARTRSNLKELEQRLIKQIQAVYRLQFTIPRLDSQQSGVFARCMQSEPARDSVEGSCIQGTVRVPFRAEVSPRLLKFYHYWILEKGLVKRDQVRHALGLLDHNYRQGKNRVQQLHQLELQHISQQKNLQRDRQRQTQVLSKLASAIEQQNRQLQKLLADKQRLEQLIKRLAAQRTVKARSLPQSRSALCHGWSWPTSGVTVVRFGDPIAQSSWRWNGVVIRGQAGQPINAAAAGKIIYAGPFTGYGLLLIIEHKNGYMTLYGYNRLLLKRAGDRVIKGDPIAKMGENGGKTAALYFAVRYYGEAVDPGKICW